MNFCTVRLSLFFVCLSVLSWQATGIYGVETTSNAIDYVRDIRPILSDNCYVCHGPNAEDREGELRLDKQDSAFGESASGAFAVVAGKPAESELLRRLTTDDEEELMPPADSGKSLTPEQVALIRRWIEQGAEWQEHWAFVAPARPELPEVKKKDWVGNPIDAFILARLEKENLQPSTAADKETILRRVTFDLTGLPPTLEEMDAFLADDSAEAYEQVVDRLLQSPHYGEHMARFWLDVARYGDTHGLHLDNYREIWPYRDWVVRAFNENKPFDKFTIEQLAGDLLPNATLEQKIATGFNRCNVSTNEGGVIEEEFYVRNVVDRVTTTGTVFLGLTLECTRCHDHKFDPLTMNDFYSLFAYFNNIDGPAMDGNIKDSQPSLLAPSPEQVVELKKNDAKLEEFASQKSKRREAGEEAFQAWYAKQRQEAAADKATAFSAPTEGLLGYYSLELQKGGKVADVIQSDRVGQTKGNVTSVPGRYGNGIKIAEQGYLDLEDVFDVEHDQSFGVGVWVNVPENATGTILSKTTSQKRGYALAVETGKVTFALIHRDDLQAIQIATSSPVLNKPGWHHLFVSYDGSSRASGLTLYVDGQRQAVEVKKDSLTDRVVLQSVDSGDAHFLIGRLGNGDGFAEGQVDELRFYDRVLPQSEVVSVMLADGVDKLLLQTPEKTSPEQLQELREYYLHQVDPAFLEIAAQENQLRLQVTALQQSLPFTLVYRERKEPRDAFLLTRGEYDQKGEKVERATLSILSPMPEGAPQNRLGFALWLVDRLNPLTARVTVNRFWTQFFGTGIVKTAEDFGSQGEVPSHPALLDWLAVEFIESGWDIKAFMKTIVMSNTYRQTSRMSPEIVKRDPGNRLLARGPRFRLDAEMLRDQALAVSGLLSGKLGGPGVKPPQPDGLWFAVGYSGSNTVRFAADTQPEQVHRRTLYTFFKRTSPPPQMSTFDAPSREACAVRRERTNTPLQALLLLNDPQYIEAARALAERVLGLESNTFDDRLQAMARLCTGHPASQATVDELRGLYDEQLKKFKDNPEAAQALIHVGQPMKSEPTDKSELAAWTMVANVILNLDETVNKN
ncbi:MAG: DUF1553 domain-containing protein [Planctomycetes bacterium]|nr:DUF1553 domain-containing protein [Planctomycetota bacterium]